jgi:cell division protein FtsW
VGDRPQRPSLGTVFRADSSNYYMLLGTTLLLVFIGLIMVLSASSVDSYLTDNNFFMGFLRQGAYAIAGIPLMLLASRVPPNFWRRWARTGVLIGIGFQLLVVWTPLGVDSGGNRNWLAIGDFTFQPAELLKLALAVWLGVMLPIAMDRYGTTWRVLRPLIPAAIIVGLVLVGGDLGTVLIMFLMTLAALYFAGVGWKFMMAPIGLGALGVFVMSVLSPNRMSRIMSFLGAPCVDDSGACWQPLHGTWALASGGIFGVGLGHSRAKWSWLPAADNDYIFAIVGEELGLIGAVVVIALFIALTVSFLRIIRAAEDDTTRIISGTIMVWLVGQGFLNIAVVLGLMPVLGVPLPFVSAGGTALVSCLVAVGVVLSFARTQGRKTP